MEAKETVMNIDTNLDEMGWSMKRDVTCLTYAWLKQAVTRQAEISFKAGQESGCYAEGLANGIGEVVEWVESNGEMMYRPYDVYRKFKTSEWQAKLKEWNI